MKADDRLVAAEKPQVVLARGVVRPGAQNLGDCVRGLENFRARGDKLGAFLQVVGVGIAGAGARPASTRTWKPALIKLGITTGTSATRRSPGKASLGTPKIIEIPPSDSSALSVQPFYPRRSDVGQNCLFGILNPMAARAQGTSALDGNWGGSARENQWERPARGGAGNAGGPGSHRAGQQSLVLRGKGGSAREVFGESSQPRLNPGSKQEASAKSPLP